MKIQIIDDRENLKPEQLAALFNEYKPMARGLANRFARIYAIPHQEVLDEAESNLALLVASWNEEGQYGFDPTRGTKRSTWVYRKLTLRLLTWVNLRRPKLHQPFSMYDSKGGDGETVEFASNIVAKPNRIDSLLRSLGEDAKIVVKTIIAAPDEIADDISEGAKIRSRNTVKQYLRTQGWSVRRVEDAWHEVELAM